MSDHSLTNSLADWFRLEYDDLIAASSDDESRRRCKPPVYCPVCQLPIFPQYHSIVTCRLCRKFRTPQDRATDDQIDERFARGHVRQCQCNDWCTCPRRLHNRIDYGPDAMDDSSNSDTSYDPSNIDEDTTTAGTTSAPVLAVGAFLRLPGSAADNHDYLQETADHYRAATSRHGSPDSVGEDYAPVAAIRPEEVTQLRRGISEDEYMDLRGQGIPDSFLRARFGEVEAVIDTDVHRIRWVDTPQCLYCQKHRASIIQDAIESQKVLLCDDCFRPRFQPVTSIDIYALFGRDVCFCSCQCTKDSSSSSSSSLSGPGPAERAPVYRFFRPRTTLGTAPASAQHLLQRLGYCERDFDAERRQRPLPTPTLDHIVQNHYPYLEPSAEEVRQLEYRQTDRFPNGVAYSTATSSGLPPLVHGSFLVQDADMFGDETRRCYAATNTRTRQLARDNLELQARLRRVDEWRAEYRSHREAAYETDRDDHHPIWGELKLFLWLNYFQDKYHDSDGDSVCSGHADGFDRQGHESRLRHAADITRGSRNLALFEHRFRHCHRRIERLTNRGGYATTSKEIEGLICITECVLLDLSGAPPPTEEEEERDRTPKDEDDEDDED